MFCAGGDFNNNFRNKLSETAYYYFSCKNYRHTATHYNQTNTPHRPNYIFRTGKKNHKCRQHKNFGEYYEVLIENNDAYDLYGHTEDYNERRNTGKRNR